MILRIPASFIGLKWSPAIFTLGPSFSAYFLRKKSTLQPLSMGIVLRVLTSLSFLR